MHLRVIASLLCSALSVSALAAAKSAPTNDELIQEFTQLPQCAVTCVTSGLSTSKCDFGDFDCLCVDEAYVASTGNCVLSSCTNKNALLTQGWQARACKAPVRDVGPMSRRINIALIAIAFISVLLRFLARWYIQGSSLGSDDWTVLASFILLIPSTTILQIMTFKGLGRDIWTVSFEDITLMFKFFYIDQYIYQVVIVITKISIVLLYLRIFPKTVSKRFWIASWTIIAGLIIYCFSFLVYSAFQCAPISYFWTQWDGEHEGYCNNFQLAVYINSGLNIFFDLTVFILPIPKLLAIQVRDKRRKVGVILTFLVGLFVTVCSMVRLKYLSRVSKITNATYEYTDITLWSGIESEVGVICACMPTITGPVLYFLREKLGMFSSFSKSDASKSTTTASRIEGDKQRLPSTSSEDGIQLGKLDHAPEHGGIKRTTDTKVYRVPSDQASDDDVNLIQQGYRRNGVNQWDV